MKLILSIFFTIFLITITKSTILQCSFEFSEIHSMNYSCEVQMHQNLLIDDEIEITANHTLKTDENVDGFIMREINSKNFPKGVEKFTKIVLLSIFECGLEKITQNNLKHFNDLKFLILSNNKISVIEPELFKFNLKLEEIDFEANPIFHIDPIVFDQLEVLKLMNFRGISCDLKQGNVDDVIAQIEAFDCTIKDWNLIYEGYERVVDGERKVSESLMRLEEILFVKEEKIQNLTEILNEKSEKFRNLTENLNFKSLKIQKLEMKINEKENLIENLQKSLNESKNQLKISTNSILNYENQISKINKSCSEGVKYLLEAKREKELEIKIWQFLKDEDETEIEKLSELKSKFETEIESFKIQIDKSEKEIENLKILKNSKEEEFEEVKSELKEKDEKLRELQSELEKVGKNNENFETPNNFEDSTFVDGLMSTTENLTTKLENSKDDQNKFSENHQSELISNLTSEIELHKSEIENLKIILTTKEKELEKLQNNLTQSERKIFELRKDFREKEVEVEKIQSKIAKTQVQDKILSLQKIIEDQKVEIKNLQNKLSENQEEENVTTKTEQNDDTNYDEETPDIINHHSHPFVSEISPTSYSPTERTIFFFTIAFLGIVVIIFIIFYCRMIANEKSYKVSSLEDIRNAHINPRSIEKVKFVVDDGGKRKKIVV